MSLIRKRIYFYNLFKSDENIPVFYDYIENRATGTVISCPIKDDSGHEICKVNHVPEYFKINYKKENNLGVKSINRDVGYAVDLSSYSDINAYVNSHFKNSRKLRKYVRRLESSFNITYKRFYGDISKDVYNDLLDRLYKMVQNRFIELNDINQQTNNNSRWQLTQNETFSLIKKKRASIFVIYDDCKPILINIAHHWGTVFYDLMVSFDVDYSKFSIGHISLYKQIEWCINNGYEIFDTGPGEYHYKKRWSNMPYVLSQQVIYNKNKLSETLIANLEIASTATKKYLFSKKLLSNIKAIKKSIRRTNYSPINYEMRCITNLEFLNIDRAEIDYNDKTYSFLRRIIYNFLYSNNEHKSNISVFTGAIENQFIIKAKNSIMLCIVL